MSIKLIMLKLQEAIKQYNSNIIPLCLSNLPNTHTAEYESKILFEQFNHRCIKCFHQLNKSEKQLRHGSAVICTVASQQEGRRFVPMPEAFVRHFGAVILPASLWYSSLLPQSKNIDIFLLCVWLCDEVTCQGVGLLPPYDSCYRL